MQCVRKGNIASIMRTYIFTIAPNTTATCHAGCILLSTTTLSPYLAPKPLTLPRTQILYLTTHKILLPYHELKPFTLPRIKSFKGVERTQLDLGEVLLGAYIWV